MTDILASGFQRGKVMYLRGSAAKDTRENADVRPNRNQFPGIAAKENQFALYIV